MFKHTVKYEDYNGNPREEDLYFHLAVHEMTRLEASIGVGLEAHITKLMADNDANELIAFLEKTILMAYGVKSSDGKVFRKTPDVIQDFEYSQAYAQFFVDLVNNPDLAKKFGEGVSDKAAKQKKNQVAPKVVAEPTVEPTPNQ